MPKVRSSKPRGEKPGSKFRGPREDNRQQGKPRFEEKSFEKKSFEKKSIEKTERTVPENLTIGRNPVMEAIKAGRTVEKLFVQKGVSEGSIRKIIAMAREKGIVIIETEREKLNAMSDGAIHQGIAATVSPYKYVEIEEMLALAKRKGEDPLILVLDEIQDPHNLGSILRSAEIMGAHGVVIPKRRAVGLTPVVAKASAGAIEYVAVAKVSNISQALEKLKAKGLWVAAAHMDGKPCYKEDLKGPLALVIGGEDQGVSKLIVEKSDYLIKIPMKGKVPSLNASVAASIILYEVFKQRVGV
jgi:23S rRNA (guanosine2251-2'-O)-methyltransferase